MIYVPSNYPRDFKAPDKDGKLFKYVSVNWACIYKGRDRKNGYTLRRQWCRDSAMTVKHSHGIS